MYARQGNAEKAEQGYERALNILRGVLGKNSPVIAGSAL